MRVTVKGPYFCIQHKGWNVSREKFTGLTEQTMKARDNQIILGWNESNNVGFGT
jgi:hypothetical protein